MVGPEGLLATKEIQTMMEYSIDFVKDGKSDKTPIPLPRLILMNLKEEEIKNIIDRINNKYPIILDSTVLNAVVSSDNRYSYPLILFS
ncbi:hypothetical protein [Coxiella endosymbiont of Ornithodoros maritimus]|uniref:hypothetical protein n=1 Tax=Coxiella endosymbiont of Ornithodoros maritimus TaxID=1656172 RepID=UPI002264DBD6|nr:hypothetical protein [Coxiella endosymbiont of Ornithodoros maritimus]